jgi:lysozyme family protein
VYYLSLHHPGIFSLAFSSFTSKRFVVISYQEEAMNLTEQLRDEVSRSISTLRRRYANTADEAERKAVTKLIAALGKKLTLLERAALLGAADILADSTVALEKAVAAARTGPFDGYLAAMEAHLQNLYTLSGAMHASEGLPPAPEGKGAARGRVVRARRGRPAKRAARAADLPLAVKDYDQLKAEYAAYFDACSVRPEQAGNIAYYVKRLNQGRPIYAQVGNDLNGIPWMFIGVIHGMECGFNFAGHLHNGDPLQARTVRVPAGRPVAGSPPFTWRQSAVDALTLKRFHEVSDWSVPHMLYLLEKYNGFGYRMRRAPSPYLWSFSNLYEKGKFVQDGQFDPEAVSKQCGAALMLKAVVEG